MFGFLTAKQELLSQEELLRYKGYYCGLCHSLKERHGNAGRLTLNYDMTFLVILLSALYEPEEISGDLRCIVHPTKRQNVIRNEFSAYAADMNVALAYLKCLDNWKDEKNPAALAEAGALKRAYERVRKSYPRQCSVIEASLKELGTIEAEGREDPDAASQTFGRLMAEIFVYREDFWQGYLRALGDNLGRFIYLLDAATDLEGDVKHHRYNPFAHRIDQKDREDYFREILKMLLGDALKAMDMLPLIHDVGILQNTLCFGIWTEFDKIYRKGTADVPGSV